MKAQTIFDLAMDLMDEKKDLATINATPESDYASTKDYQARTPGILTILQSEVVMELKKRGIDVDSLDEIKTLEDECDLDDMICSGILPYGLAARLLGQEDANLSNYFNSLYMGKLSDAYKISDDKIKAVQEKREDVYDSLLRW